MNRKFLIASDQVALDKAAELLANGWEFAPEYEGEPIRLEWSLVFPLVLYESEEERPKAVVEERNPGEFEDVDSIISVDINAADEKLCDGYRVLEAFAKTVTLVKRRKPKEKAV